MPLPKTGKRTDAQRRAQNKYDRENVTVLSCKMRKSDAEDFKAACKDSGTTVNAVFTRAAEEFVKNYAEEKLLNGSIKHGAN